MGRFYQFLPVNLAIPKKALSRTISISSGSLKLESPGKRHQEKAKINQFANSRAKPNIKRYCAVVDLVRSDHIEQAIARTPAGPNAFTPKMNHDSQSFPRILPAQKPEIGHAAIPTRMSPAASSNQAICLSIWNGQETVRNIFRVWPLD